MYRTSRRHLRVGRSSECQRAGEDEGDLHTLQADRSKHLHDPVGTFLPAGALVLRQSRHATHRRGPTGVIVYLVRFRANDDNRYTRPIVREGALREGQESRR